MKFRNFTLIAVAAVSIALTSCNKLASPKFDFQTGLLSVNMKTLPVDTIQTIEVIAIAQCIDSIDIQKTLDSSVSYADSKGYVVKESDILNGKINTILVTNANPSDTRSFCDYYTQFDVSIKTNESGAYLPIGEPIVIMPHNTNKVEAAVTGNAFNTYLPSEIPAKGTKTPLYVVVRSKPKRVILPGEEFALKVSVNSTIQVSKK